MEKWTPLLIITTILVPATNQANDHGCSYESMFNDGKQIICVNVSSAFFQYSGINFIGSHWLTCKNCNLSLIANDTFNFPKNTINYLILIDNNVTDVSSSAFNNLPFLKVLNLRSNFLSKLNLSVFSGIRRLLHLDLSKNLLQGLEKDVFLELENLDILNLNNNRITYIAEDAFTGVTNLKYLYLNQNGIEKLENNTFKHLINLKVLYLENNKISEIQPLAFNKLENLNYLYLNNNSIYFLFQYNFKPLVNLMDLQLRFNDLTEIDTSTFNGLKNIKFLYLGQNNLANVRQYGFIGLNSLQILDLIDNKFEYFTLDYFKDMENLSTLWLESNYIDNFTIHYHSQTQRSLKILSLMSNKLEFFNYKLLHEKLPLLEELWIGKNPWKCNFLIEMYDYFRNNNVSICTHINCKAETIEAYIQSVCFEPFQNETEITIDFITDGTARNNLNVLQTMIVPLLISYAYCIISTSF